MTKDITYYAKNRHSTKSFDTTKKISDENIDKIKDLLKYSPSSVNLQPWHFVIASTDEAKAKIAKSTQNYAFNTQAILDASHVIVFSTKAEMDDAHLLDILNQEEKDGRFKADPETLRANTDGARNFFLDYHRKDLDDASHWMDKQVYLNLGAFMLGVATLGIDSLPMEGIDTKVLSDELGLTEMGYNGLVVLPIGYSDRANDYNANIAKSRLDHSKIITEI